MKFTLSWLLDHLDTDAPVERISERLTMIGLEVESVDDPRPALAPIVVGHVIEAGPHPNADRLHLCRVEYGAAAPLQVVCGAPNARAGLKVALALPGTRIPASGEVLKKGAIRGVESQGMMCSWRELGLGEDHSGIIELDPAAPVGKSLVEVLPFDPVFDISITPNRADCLGVRGVARDLAASGLGRLKPLEIPPVPGRFTSPIGVRLEFTPETASACPLFAGRHVRGIRNGDSPQWLKDRLTAIGLRPISALVDITNYLTYDYGRPLHVFDAAKVTGDVRARLARPGETLEALNGKTYVLDGEMTVIADEAGPEGLAGVMGGEHSGCTAETTEVFLEAALFDPMRTAATGRKLGIESDARYRFERGLDPEFAIAGMELATRLILEFCGGEASEPVVAGSVPVWRRTITLHPQRVDELGGLALDTPTIIALLEGLGCVVTIFDSVTLEVQPPSWRADLGGEHDLVEEVIRINGYDRIPVVPLPRDPMPHPVLTPGQRRIGFARRALASRGMVETVTWSFLPAAQAGLFGGGQPELVLANPISADLDTMRPSLLPNLIAAAGRNADRGMKDLALFEIGAEFHGDRPGDQRTAATGLRVGRSGPRHWAQPPRNVDVFDAKADALAAIAAAGGPADGLAVTAEAPDWYHPGRSGALKLGSKVVAWFGEIHPRVLRHFDVKGPMAGFELFFDALPLPKPRPTKARPLLAVLPLQPVERDFAFLVGADVPSDAVVRAARGSDKALITEVAVFDLYEGAGVAEGHKSLAISVTLQPREKTLTDAEIEAVSAKLVEAVTKATGATLRG